jgi:nucleotide-binding universal stress UspA family protein
VAFRVLIALDHSPGAWHAVEYVAQTFATKPGLEVTLLHILTGSRRFSGMLAALGKIDSKARQRLVMSWQVEQEKKWNSLVRRARERLAAAGVPAEAVTSKFFQKSYDVAEDILREAQLSGCRTIVMGRRGLGTARALLLGSVSQKVAEQSRGCAVTIVQ